MDSLFYQRLAADSALAALVGTKLYPVWPTNDSKLPYVAYARDSTEDVLVLGGPSGIKRYEFGVDAWAIDAATTRTIADAVYNCLTTWRDTVKGVFLVTDTQEQTEAGYHSRQTFSVWA